VASPAGAPRVIGGIEWFPTDRGEEPQCARCGSSVEWLDCTACDEGYSHHDCGEDSCCCSDPYDNVICGQCGGEGGSWHCISGVRWCEDHPMSGREDMPSTALNPEAWYD
jgi:hypothetical protein